MIRSPCQITVCSTSFCPESNTELGTLLVFNRMVVVLLASWLPPLLLLEPSYCYNLSYLHHPTLSPSGVRKSIVKGPEMEKC